MDRLEYKSEEFRDSAEDTAQPENNFEEDNTEILRQILEGEYIYPVYQPIVSLTDGEIYGYEALSRISRQDLKMDIEQMFRTADRMEKLWELETLCRKKALANAESIDKNKKLFINVNSNIIYDDEFKEGFTKKRLHQYGLDARNIIFEITERASVVDSRAFLGSIRHYKKQSYNIAIDDVGAGFSGLNMIADAKPHLIKLDMNLIHNIDKDETKQLLCKAMVGFGKSAGIMLIAEGIETKEELETLIKLEVNLGQGYFLGLPQKSFGLISPEKIRLIEKFQEDSLPKRGGHSLYPSVGPLSKLGYTFSPDELLGDVYEAIKLNPVITEFTVVENGIAFGFMTRAALSEIFSGRYGYSLYSKKTIRQHLNAEFLSVDYNMTIDKVSRLAMQRAPERLYNPVVVEKDRQYIGIVTIKDLLESCTKVEIDAAVHCNPLTGLPGNLLIEKEITDRIFGNGEYCITYYDLDNFKAYNDAYSFQNGDKMLALVADILTGCATRDEFVGHIGGDDFIVIADYKEGESYCEEVVSQFSQEVLSLYNDEDVKNGYIVSKNRNGVTETFPIASLSIAGVSNRKKSYQSTEDFSGEIAQLKKKCKRQQGNYYEII